jgi:hypothetical protein
LHDLYDHFDLDGESFRQRRDANGSPGVPTPVPKNRDQQVGAAIDNSGLVGKVRCGVDHAEDTDDPDHASQISKLRLQRAKQT